MRIQTKLTGFFIIMLAAFSYAMLWISTQAYQDEVYRLNSEVSQNRLREMYQIVGKEYELFRNGTYNINRAKRIAVKKIETVFHYSSDKGYCFPLVISGNKRFLLRPPGFSRNDFPWSSVSLYDIAAPPKKTESAEPVSQLPDAPLYDGEPEPAELLNIPENNPEQEDPPKEEFKSRMLYSNIGGDERIILSIPFKRPDWNWLLCYSYPVNYKLYGINTQWYSRQLFALVCCMAASAAVLFWLIQISLSPLDRLVSSATEMAAGIFPKHRKKPHYPNDEIGFLSKAFDEMASRIQHSMNKLQMEIKERREKEREIRELIENTPLPIVVLRNERAYSVNNMFTRIFGYGKSDLKTFDDWFALSAPPDISTAENSMIWKKLIESEDAGSELVLIRCKSGNILEVEVRHKRVEKQVLLIFNDLTEVKEAEKRLRTTRNYLTQLFNSIHLLLVGVDENGRITQWNQAIEEFTGIKSEFAIGVELWNVALFLLNYRDEVREAINSGVSHEKYRENISWRKRSYVFNISINPLLHKDNKGAVIILEDVTELERKNELLFQAQKMETVGTLTGGLAHDFNNVLGGIKGSLSMIKYYLKNSPEKPEQVNEFIGLAEESVSRAASMVEQLLALSRKSQLTLKKFDLTQALDHVLKICKGTFDKSVNIKFHKPKGEIMVKADQVQMEQVFLNLLINAEHAMTVMRDDEDHIGGDIDIAVSRVKVNKVQFPKASPDENYWKITIQDRGVGIKPENMQKIFDPFFTTKIKSKGTGLGLAMVYNIIDLHNGFIEAHSKPDNGSTFTVYIPELPPDESEFTLTSDTNDLYLGSGWILIIDDEAAIRITATKMLELLGYSVLTAGNGQEGIKVFNEHQKEIRAVILDMAMPVMTGDEAYKRLQEIDPQVKVLIATGFTNDQRVRKTLESGADGFIKKPYSVNVLSRKLHEIINS
ncbi:MAG: PAS domain S-box protein [Victivallales bacterium]|nr:PAS domain S-box protein [Victivallales bacterium]